MGESSGLLNLLKKKRHGRVPENPDRLDVDAKKENGGSGLSLPDSQAQEGGSVDLLGLGVPSAGTNGTVNGGTGVTNNITKFYCKSNGVLYENDIIQIGVKTECRANLARLAIFYGNKTNLPFLNFQPNVTT